MIKFDFTKTPITQIADYIIISAAKSNASDIHFDPREDGMMVRLRVDGDLQNFTFIPKTYERNLTTRLKLLANMNITESRLPQDGAIKGNFGGMYLDMRVSCLPLNEGEKIVVRILDYSRSLQGIDSLGFNESNAARLKRMIQVPNGIILITGATGSGKSTTVYSILQVLNKEETNIITVEDPIEMNIEGLNQVQVNAEIGMTFAAALRSILRQDPNIILIGEIRDSETAQIAVRSAITGHLVLSTIHTNNALSTVERLLDMNVERYLLSTALTGIISQRLAKRMCTKCRIERETTPFEKRVFKKYMHKDVDKIWDVNPNGCDACRKGYRGRIAIQEVLELDDEMRNALNNENLSKEELSKLVYSDKVITMLQDALGKVLDGIISFEEVLRVIEIEDAEDFFENDVYEKLKDKEKLLEEQKMQAAQAQVQGQAGTVTTTTTPSTGTASTSTTTTPTTTTVSTPTTPTNTSTSFNTTNGNVTSKPLEVVALNSTPLNTATPVNIPTMVPNTGITNVKAGSANTLVNSLGKIEATTPAKPVVNTGTNTSNSPIPVIEPQRVPQTVNPPLASKVLPASTPVNSLEKIQAIDMQKQGVSQGVVPIVSVIPNPVSNLNKK